MAINFPSSPVVNQTYSSGSKTWYWTGTAWKLSTAFPDIIPIDNLSGKFDGVEQRFIPNNNGSKITINNPLRLLISLNGIIQTVTFPETVWLSGYVQDGFYVDSDGYLSFTEVPPAGSTFDGKIINGPDTQSTYVKTYPFRPIDILLGV